MRYLFIFGMYRSGTTTLSKTIDCLDGVVVKNDAIFFWFKSIRNLLLKGNKKLKNSLFDHYLFDDNQIELFKRLQKIDINKKIFDKKFFIKNILKDTRKYQPGLERIILENKSKTYKNFIKFFLNEIAKEKKKLNILVLKKFG